MTAAPLVTVLMAVYNGGAYLDEAVESILRQTFGDFEFLIIDDASTDDTPARLAGFRDPRIRIVRNDRNLGLTRSLNRGLALARGTLIARQDADDRSHPGRLRAQVDFLEREPEVVVVGAAARYIDARGRPKTVAPWPKGTSALAIRWQLLFESPFVHSSVTFRTVVVRDELGGYDESFTTSQDYELWSRIASRGYVMRNLPEVLVDFRTHDASASTRYEREGIARIAAVLERHLIAELGPNVPVGWPDAWIRLTNPRAFPDSGNEWQTVARAIEMIYRGFTARHSAAASDTQIRRHVASMLIRLSNWGAERWRPASIAAFAHACRLDPLMSALAAPRYVGHWTLGRWRRAGRHALEQLSRK